jgi:hypothetical protein
MATSTFRNNQLHSQKRTQATNETTLYTSYRSVGVEFGFIMVLTAVLGIFLPHFLGLNLSFMHSLVLGAAGALSVYGGMIKNPSKAYRINLGLGIFFLLNAVIGYMVGDAGAPRFGFYPPEQLDRMAPGFLELATTDHLVHALLALVFFIEALTWKFHIYPSHAKPFLHSRPFRIGMRILSVTVIFTIIVAVVYNIRGF